MADMPTVGLQVDLNEIIAAKAQYSALEDQIAEIGGTAAATSDALIQMDSQQRAMLASRVALTNQANAQAIAQDATYLKARIANTAAEIQADAAASKASQASDAATLAFRMRMTQQMAAATASQTKADMAAWAANSAAVGATANEFEAGAAKIIASNEAAGLSALQIREPVMLVREALRGDFSRMAGSVSLLAQAYGLITPETLAFAGAAIAIAIPVGIVAYAMISAAGDAAKLSNALAETSDASGLTAGSFQEMAQRISASSGENLGAARADLLKMVESGEFTSQTMELMGDSAQKFGDLMHESSTKAIDDFEKLAEGPTKYAEAFEQAHGAFTAGQIAEIQQLEDRGDKQQAEFVAMQAIYAWIHDQAPAQLDPLTGAWRTLTNTIDGALNAVRNFTTVQGPAQQIAAIDAQLAASENGPRLPGAGGRPGQLPHGPATVTSNLPGASHGTQYTDTIEGLEAHRAALVADMNAQNAAAQAQADATNETKQASAAVAYLDEKMRAAGGSAAYADAKVAEYDAHLTALRTAIAHTTDPGQKAALKVYDPTPAEQAKEEARLRQRNDRIGKVPKGPSMTGAVNSLAVLQSAVADLQKQIDAVDADPMSDLSAKIIKAGDAARAAATAGPKSGTADERGQLAEQKELATVTLQWVDAQAKATRQAQEQGAAVQIATEAEKAQADIMLAYYQGGSSSAEGYAAALNAVNASQVKSQEAQSDLTIAQQFGVKSLDDIAAHMLSKLPADIASTAAAQKEAQAVQDQAKAHAAAADALIVENNEKARQKQLDDTLTAGAKLLQQTQEEAKAYADGALALAAYTRQQEINKQIQASGGQLSPEAAAAIVDKQTIATNALLTAQTDLTRQVDEGSAAREADALQAQILAGYLAKMGTSSSQLTEDDKKRLTTQAQIEAVMRQQIIDSQKLEIAIEDSIRTAFINTGKLDFSSLQKAVEQSLNKAIYDAFLAKPIDMIVKATVQWEQKALNWLFGGAGNPSSAITSLFGGGSSGNPFGALGANISSGINTAMSGILSGIKSIAGPAAIAFGAYQISSQLGTSLAKSLGGDADNAIVKIFGPVGAIISALTSGPGGSNHRTVYGFTPTGDLGQFNAVTSDQPTAATEANVQAISSSVSQFISGLDKAGIDAQDILSGIQYDQITLSRLYYNSGPGAGAAGVQVTSNDPNAIVSDIEKYLIANAQYANPQEQALVQQMIAANDTLDQIEAGITAFTQAQTDFTNVTTGLLQYTNPALYATQTLQSQQIATRQTLQQEIQAGDFTPAQIAQLATDLPQLEQQQIQAALAGVAIAGDGAAHSLADFATAQQNVITFVNGLMVGTLSALSPTDQLAAAQAEYASQLASAQSGNYDALTGITNTAQTYLTQAQKVYGSGTAYNQVFTDVTSALTGLGSNLQDNAQIDAINAASAALQAAITAGSLQITQAVNDNTAAGSSNDNSSALTAAQVTSINNQIAGGAAATVDAIDQAFAQLIASLGLAVQTQTALLGGLAA